MLILPSKPGKPGCVLEFKRMFEQRSETPEAALDSAMQQIDKRDYAAELRAAGAAPIHRYAIAFQGKQLWMKGDTVSTT